MYKKILVPVDGSAAANRGLEEVIKAAKAFGGVLRRIALGSDAEMVLRSAPVPVLLVREGPEAA